MAISILVLYFLNLIGSSSRDFQLCSSRFWDDEAPITCLFWMHDAVFFNWSMFNLSISRLVSEVGYSAAASACEKGEQWKWAVWAADCGLNIAWGMVAAIWECLKVVCTATSNGTLDWGKYRKTVIKKKQQHEFGGRLFSDKAMQVQHSCVWASICT